jgi:hypothetical protein
LHWEPTVRRQARDPIASALSRRANQVWHQRLLVR